jgi:DNA-binding NtrC family response regulator
VRILVKRKVDIMQVNEDCLQSGSTILVVDDDASVTASYSRVLKGRCRVLSTNDGSTASKLLAAIWTVDLLVLDLTMPDYDGIELLQDLADKGSYLPVALISGWNTEVLSSAGLLATALGHKLIGVYPKPTSIGKIVDEAGISLNSP